jgi:hypothetical protein
MHSQVILQNYIFKAVVYKKLNNFSYSQVKCHILLDSRWRPFSHYLADSSDQLCVCVWEREWLCGESVWERERERKTERERESKKKREKRESVCVFVYLITEEREREVVHKYFKIRRLVLAYVLLLFLFTTKSNLFDYQLILRHHFGWNKRIKWTQGTCSNNHFTTKSN